MSKGGARIGSGRKKGGLASHTLEAQARKQRIVQRVNEATDVLIDSQLSLARGISFLYRIDKDEGGKKEKPKLIVSSTEIESYLRGDYDGDPDTYYYITTEKPSNMAIDSLFDRVHGKAPQSVDLTSDGKPIPLLSSINVYHQHSSKEVTQAPEEN